MPDFRIQRKRGCLFVSSLDQMLARKPNGDGYWRLRLLSGGLWIDDDAVFLVPVPNAVGGNAIAMMHVHDNGRFEQACILRPGKPAFATTKPDHYYQGVLSSGDEIYVYRFDDPADPGVASLLFQRFKKGGSHWDARPLTEAVVDYPPFPAHPLPLGVLDGGEGFLEVLEPAQDDEGSGIEPP